MIYRTRLAATRSVTVVNNTRQLTVLSIPVARGYLPPDNRRYRSNGEPGYGEQPVLFAPVALNASSTANTEIR